ncbi:DUF3284 domain-containing protein [Lactiplantibacillus mudanjiangensis]|uniref:DUF3284 domain-containing protein n=1 Tax=Lactiplantibacillus mudanjiangensis TaxID=1296538 RepID=A0A660E1G7_9LACO|nr:DUF3284 domain-containing protein [Lactiplantibacillus mudanjiangensis]VDG22810.1 hypothetical protein [Lactobacillus sp. CBA3605] [Lactiplantibacillus mudanjiangensis]VDG26618.1 hypothetical protein [Lactobacillus sp. CBA3605] [Lactiplantibacillus mudanjiangensis]VDG31852.1 hypothetical protein [Lactobacillus sp. CBA3605] [Lactiplantibacillus mudanjiangensis]
MQISLTLNAPVDYLYQQLIGSARVDIQQQTGKPAPKQGLAGYRYTKKWANGMEGHLTITHAEPGQRYAYELETPRDHYGVDYQFIKNADHETQLTYAETMLGKDARTQANNRIGAALLGWFRKRRFKKMMRQMAASYYN